MHKQLTRNGFAPSQLGVLRAELERERTRAQRTLGEDETSDEYSAILNALERLYEPDFGICVTCARPITFGRLTVLPATEYCVSCSR